MPASSYIQKSYHHLDKRVVPQAGHESAKGSLKYYLIERSAEPISGEIAAMDRTFVETKIANEVLDDDQGFVIVHKCGTDFYFLLVGLWRGNNELWEAVYYFKTGMTNFEIFKPAYPGVDSPMRPTFCVWELGVVSHESNCWIQFLISQRQEEDIARWRKDMFKGIV